MKFISFSLIVLAIVSSADLVQSKEEVAKKEHKTHTNHHKKPKTVKTLVQTAITGPQPFDNAKLIWNNSFA